MPLSLPEFLSRFPAMPDHPGNWGPWHARIAQTFTGAEVKDLQKLKLLSNHLVAHLFPGVTKSGTLTREQANTFFRVLQVLTVRAGVETGDDAAARWSKAALWLQTPHAGLKGHVPGELLSTPQGADYALTAAARR